jgi:hypothetical protein
MPPASLFWEKGQMAFIGQREAMVEAIGPSTFRICEHFYGVPDMLIIKTIKNWVY